MSQNQKTSEAQLPAESSSSASLLMRFLKFLQKWIFKNRFYIIAFIIPVILTYLAYAIFGLYPFGKYSVLCLDLNGQYVYYYEALRDAVMGDGSIFYNWSRNLSGEFVGTIGYYTASPFMIFVMLLPEKYILTAVLLMQLAKVGTSAVTFSYYLQKSKKLEGHHALVFSLMYAMMAYVMIQLIDPMWLDGVVYLPLIMLGVEYLVDCGKRLNLIIPLALMFIAHFYIGYMIAIFTAIYFLYYMFLGTPQRGRAAKEMIMTILRAVSAAVVALMCSAIMLLPMYHALSLGKFEFTEPDFSFKFQFDLIGLFRQLMCNQYDSVNVQGSPEIYCGVLTVVMLPIFFMNKKIDKRRKLGYAAVIIAMLLCMAIRPVDMAWHGFQSPNWLPYRYSFVFSFILLSMAAEAFRNLGGIKPSFLAGILVGYVALYSFVYFMIPKDGLAVDMKYAKFEYKSIDVLTSYVLSMVLAAVYLVLIYFANGGKIKPKKETVKRGAGYILTSVMLLFVGAEATFNAVCTFKDVDDEVAYSTEKSWTNYVKNGRKVTEELYKYDDSLYRCEKTYFRCINDNMAFGLRGLSHSTSVMNSNCLSFLEAMGYAARTYYCRYDGNTPVSDSLLGIKYVLDRESDNSKIMNHDYTPVFNYKYTDQDDKEQTITCYENPDALSIGYMADSDILSVSALGNDNPFNSQNIFMSTIAGETEFANGGFGSYTNYYKPITLDSDPILTNIAVSDYGDQTCYTAENKDDPGANTIDFNFTVTEESPIYFYFRTDNESPVNLWYGPWNDSTQSYTYDWLSTYFETEHYCIMTLGSYAPGTKVSLRMTVANDYTIFRNYYFVYFDNEVFSQSIEKLKKQQMEITDWTARTLEGKVTAEDGQVLLTSVPYEDGWTVKVDGRKVEPKAVVNALIGIEMEAGEHEISMKYTPPGWWTGVILLILGIGVIVVFEIYDKKKAKELISAYEKHTKK